MLKSFIKYISICIACVVVFSVVYVSFRYPWGRTAAYKDFVESCLDKNQDCDSIRFVSGIPQEEKMRIIELLETHKGKVKEIHSIFDVGRFFGGKVVLDNQIIFLFYVDMGDGQSVGIYEPRLGDVCEEGEGENSWLWK